MTDASWLPSLVILGVGVAAGVILALRLRRGGEAKSEDPEIRDLELEVRDLERRRDDLYDRLRGLKGEIDEAERARLEEAAARTLRQLDLARAKLPGGEAEEKPARARKPETVAARAAPPATPAAAGGGVIARHPLLSGFLLGGGLMAVVGLLVYWAIRDAGPRPDMSPPPPVAAAGDDPHGAGELTPEAAARIQELQARLTADPTDLGATKELSLVLLSQGMFFDAYRVSERILELQPEDPDGLYVQGVVKLSMGQNDGALDALDRVLAQYPDHLQALIYRGLAQQQAGNVDQALDTWEYAVDVAGGSHPDIEELIRRAREARQAGAVPAPPPAAAAPATSPPTPAAEPAPAAGSPLAPPSDPSAYAIRVRLAQGISAPPGASLFVFLRTGETGPPVAVKRLAAGAFPIDLVLSADDSMTGADLPADGLLFVRLDRDGNASTSEGDLALSLPVRAGTAVEAVLGE